MILVSTEECFHRLSFIPNSLPETRPAVAAQTEGEQHLLRTRASRGVNLDCKSSITQLHKACVLKAQIETAARGRSYRLEPEGLVLLVPVTHMSVTESVTSASV